MPDIPTRPSWRSQIEEAPSAAFDARVDDDDGDDEHIVYVVFRPQQGGALAPVPAGQMENIVREILLSFSRRLAELQAGAAAPPTPSDVPPARQRPRFHPYNLRARRPRPQ